MTRLLLALDNWRRRASDAGLGLPLGILAVTATFWLVVWLADQALQGSISPVGALTRIYGTGAVVLLTLLMVAIAVWMLVQRLGYRDAFFDGQSDSTEQQSPAPRWDSSIPDFTGQITKLVSSMDAPASPLPPTAPAAAAAGSLQRNDNPADGRTPSADQAAPAANGENGQQVAPAPKPKTAPEPEPTKPAASPAADAPAAAKSAAKSAAPSSAQPVGSFPVGKSAKGKSAPGKSDPSKSAPGNKKPGKKAQAKSCASKPLLKRKGRK
ncbi:hypothetical protein [Arthrobacter crystallopoietes]|nr:hypothetical protein [Arthrobacter crystallopoietes]